MPVILVNVNGRFVPAQVGGPSEVPGPMAAPSTSDFDAALRRGPIRGPMGETFLPSRMMDSDTLAGGVGDDTLTGGAGADTLDTSPPAGATPPISVGRTSTQVLADATLAKALKNDPQSDFFRNLMAFGAATMAAGGRPGATALGSVGQGALSAMQQAQQDENSRLQQALIGETLVDKATTRQRTEQQLAIQAQLAANPPAGVDPTRFRLALAGLKPNDFLGAVGETPWYVTKRDGVATQTPNAAQLMADIDAAKEWATTLPKAFQSMLSTREVAPGAMVQSGLAAGLASGGMQLPPQAGNLPIPSGPGVPGGMIFRNDTPAPAPNINLTQNADKTLSGGLNDAMVAGLAKSREAAQSAVTSMQSGQVMQAMLDKDRGIISGTGANLNLGIQKLLSGAGIIEPNAVANTETFRSTVGTQVMSKVKALGSGNGITDADVRFTERVVGGDITLDDKSIRRIVKINAKADENIIARHNADVAKIKGRNGVDDSVISYFTVAPPQPGSYTVPGVTDVQPAPLADPLGIRR